MIIFILIRLVGYIFRVLKLILNNKHLLIFLLTLEGIMVIVIGSLIINIFMGILNLRSLILFMVIIVSEGVLGLGILVILVRGVGEDKFCFLRVI